MSQTILYTLFIAFSFSVWPIVSRYGKIPAIWTAIIVNLATALAAIIYLLYKGDSTPNSKMVLIGVAVGLLNGVGFLVYSNLITNTTIPVSTMATIIDVMIPIITLILGLLFLKETLSAYRILGFILSIGGIYFLLKK